MSSQTIVTIVMGVLNIVVFSIMSRLLSKEVFGYYAALWAVVTIFQSISTAGLGSAVIQNKNYSESFYSTAFSLSLLISSVLAMILFFSAPLLARLIINEELTLPLRFLSIILITTSLESVGRGILIRQLKFLKFGIIQIVSYSVSYGLGIILAVKGMGVYSLVVAALLNSILICLLVFITGVHIPRLGIHRNECKAIVSFGGWLTASVLVNQLTTQLDKLVLSKWLSVEALGSYSRPSGFVSSVNEKINSIVDTTLFPILSSIQDCRERIASALERGIGLLNSFSCVLAAVFFFNAELIISVFFGKSWLDLVWVLRIISIGVIFSVDARLVDCFFRSLGLVKDNFWLRLLCMFIMIASLYIGARFGILYTAVAVVTANIVSITIKFLYLCFKLRIGAVVLFKAFFQSLKPVILLCIVGIPFICIETSMLQQWIFAFVFGAIIVVEFFCIPSMVGSNYVREVGEYIVAIKQRLSFKNE